MRIGEGVEWGVHCAAVLAGLPAGATLPGQALAELHGVSETYLRKHLQALTAAGLLESVPGPKGGYRLARRAEEISLLELVQALEGPEGAFRCTEIRARGPVEVPGEPGFATLCAINRAMLRAELAWRESLGRTTLAELAAEAVAGMGERRLERAVAWLRERVRTPGAQGAQGT
jgi:Rrf2 family protein